MTRLKSTNIKLTKAQLKGLELLGYAQDNDLPEPLTVVVLPRVCNNLAKKGLIKVGLTGRVWHLTSLGWQVLSDLPLGFR